MNTNNDYKRKSREVNPDTRQKISLALKGRSKSMTHRDNISKGLKNYWEHIPTKNENTPVDKSL